MGRGTIVHSAPLGKKVTLRLKPSGRMSRVRESPAEKAVQRP